MNILLMIIGIVCILYCLLLFVLGGYGTKFFLIWGAIGIACILWAKWGNKLISALPKGISRTFYACVAVGLPLFVAVEGMIISGFFAKAPADLDYLVVLGAQLKPSGPSYVLQM